MKYFIRYFMRFFICNNVTPWKLQLFTVLVQNIKTFDIKLLLNYTRAVKMAEKRNLNFVLKYYQNSN